MRNFKLMLISLTVTFSLLVIIISFDIIDQKSRVSATGSSFSAPITVRDYGPSLTVELFDREFSFSKNNRLADVIAKTRIVDNIWTRLLRDTVSNIKSFYDLITDRQPDSDTGQEE